MHKPTSISIIAREKRRGTRDSQNKSTLMAWGAHPVVGGTRNFSSAYYKKLCIEIACHAKGEKTRDKGMTKQIHLVETMNK